MNAPASTVPSAVEVAEAAFLALMDERPASIKDGRLGRARREWSALSEPIEFAKQVDAFRRDSWDCDGFDAKIEEVAALGDGILRGTDALRPVGVVVDILGNVAAGEGRCVMGLDPVEIEDVEDYAAMLCKVAELLRVAAGVCRAIRARPAKDGAA